MLKPVLSKQLYEHFLTLHVAASILLSYSSEEHIKCAEQLLKFFVECAVVLYGKEFFTYNVHCLVHLAKNCLRFGPLDSFSAFPFENYLQKVKFLVHTGSRPLEQLAKRIEDTHRVTSFKVPVIANISKCHVDPLSQHSNGPTCGLLWKAQYHKVHFGTTVLRTESPDRSVLLKDGRVLLINNFLLCDDKLFDVGQELEQIEDLYSHPCHSSLVSVFSARGGKRQLLSFSASNIA